MQPITLLKPSEHEVRFVLTDIDDTITDEGKLGAPAYRALWDLHEHGYGVIPVTGRPSGWCDMIIRQWPVDAVVGENGAFVYYTRDAESKTDGSVPVRIGTLYHPEVAGGDPQERLAGLRKKILAEIPGTRVARDQPGRRFDLAIDFREDPPYLGFDIAEQIRALCVSEGAEAKISSIHVNTWFGKYDKLSMTKIFFQEYYGMGEKELREQVLFCGDSPNDQPMFEFFPLSVGVANIREMMDHISNPPAYVTKATGGAGFVEIARVLLGS